MKKLLVFALAAAMFMSPLMSTAAAMEPVRKTQIKEEYAGPRGGRYHRGRGRRHRGGSGGWVAAGILGAALVGTAIASSSRRSSPTYVYEQPTVVYPSTPTYVYPSTPSYVYPSTTTTYSYPSSGSVVVDPNVYTYDANGNLVPYYPSY